MKLDPATSSAATQKRVAYRIDPCCDSLQIKAVRIPDKEYCVGECTDAGIIGFDLHLTRAAAKSYFRICIGSMIRQHLDEVERLKQLQAELE